MYVFLYCTDADNNDNNNNNDNDNDDTDNDDGGTNVHRYSTNTCDASWFLVGGDKSEWRIYDVNNGSKPIFKGRNVKPDKLQLEQPQCVRWRSTRAAPHGGRGVAPREVGRRIFFILTCAQY